jgi:hypothetical protein
MNLLYWRRVILEFRALKNWIALNECWRSSALDYVIFDPETYELLIIPIGMTANT